MLESTVGQILINEGIPKPLQDYNRVFDQNGMNNLLNSLARDFPDEYKKTVKHLADVGGEVAYRQGGLTFGLNHLQQPDEVRNLIKDLKGQINAIHQDTKSTPEQKNDRVVKLLSDSKSKMQELSYGTALKAKNPLAIQASLGFRGDPGSINSMLGVDTIYNDAAGKPIPLPIMRSYSQGLTPFGFLASSFSTRQGVAATKLATAESGALNKQLTQAAHRVVVGHDDEENDWYKPEQIRGLPVKTNDIGNIGAVLAHDAGGISRNTILTPRLLAKLKEDGVEDLLVRSPMVGGAADGSIHSRDAGLRTKSTLPSRGFVLGVQGGQGVGEPLTQMQLSRKHGGAAASNKVSGFKFIEMMANPPKNMPYGATHAQLDGTVDKVIENPAGGLDLMIGGKKHYVSSDNPLKVKEGDTVEAGDVLSEGTPNPREIVQHKGVGEGKRYLLNSLYGAYRENKIGAKMLRRNLEPVVRGIVNHVKLDDFWEGHAPDDVINYSHLESKWQPRSGFEVKNPHSAVGKYLEAPILHHTIGTKIRPSMLDEFKRFGIDSLVVHPDPPPFTPHMVRATDNLQHDPDWQVRLGGQYLERGLLDAAHRGLSSSTQGTSFIPALMQGKDLDAALAPPLPKPAAPPAAPKPKSLLPL